MLTFNAAEHRYFWNGEPVPNVTRIIAPLIDLSMIPVDTLERARQEGVEIHRMANLHFEGRLNVDAMHQTEKQRWLVPHYKALLQFEAETGFECWQSEKLLYHHGLRFAGTTDNIGLLTHLKDVKGPAVIDVKRSLYGGPATGLQLAAYRKGWNDGDGKSRDLKIPETNRFALELRKNGAYRLTRFDDPDDEVAFISCLHQLRWKERKYGRA